MKLSDIDQSFIMAMAVIFMALGILYQVVIGVLYQRMIQSTDTLWGEIISCWGSVRNGSFNAIS